MPDAVFSYPVELGFEQVLPFWRKLWPNRASSIETHSAMRYCGGFDDVENFKLPVQFHGLTGMAGNIIAVNSVHLCVDGSARSRGLWVEKPFRCHSAGFLLLLTAISWANKREASKVWSFPRKSSVSVYLRAGFQISSPWVSSETSPENAYCYHALPLL